MALWPGGFVAPASLLHYYRVSYISLAYKFDREATCVLDVNISAHKVGESAYPEGQVHLRVLHGDNDLPIGGNFLE